jgi:putative endonuclease
MGRYQKIKGDIGEKAVLKFLVQKGAAVIAENYRVQGGEIDLIVVHGDKIRFVEVKTRKSSDLDLGLAAVGKRKQKLIIRAAVIFCSEHVIDLQPSFDVALVCMDNGCIQDITYFENAFGLFSSDSLF